MSRSARRPSRPPWNPAFNEAAGQEPLAAGLTRGSRTSATSFPGDVCPDLAGYQRGMRSNVGRIAERTTRLVPSPFLRWALRLAVKLLLPLAGAAATAGIERVRGRLGYRTGPGGMVVVEIDRELQILAPASGKP